MFFAIGEQSEGYTLFKTASSVYRGSSELFTALRWTTEGASQDIAFAYRESTMAATKGGVKYVTINKTTFKKGGKYKVMVLANNSSTLKNYIISGKTYNLPANKFHIWVNDTQLSNVIGPDFSRSIEIGDDGLSIAIANGKPLNSFLFQTSKSGSDKDLKKTYRLSDIIINY